MTKRFMDKLGEVDFPNTWMYIAVSNRTEYLITLRNNNANSKAGLSS